MLASVTSRSTWQNNSPHAIQSTAEASPPTALAKSSGRPSGATKNSKVVADTTADAAKINPGAKGARRRGRKASTRSPTADAASEMRNVSTPRALSGVKMPFENHDPYTQAMRRPRPK